MKQLSGESYNQWVQRVKQYEFGRALMELASGADPEIVKKLSGENNAGYDHRIYKWKNIKTGQLVSMTRHELYTKYNLRKEHVGRVAQKQKGFKTVQGWQLDE